MSLEVRNRDGNKRWIDTEFQIEQLKLKLTLSYCLQDNTFNIVLQYTQILRKVKFMEKALKQVTATFTQPHHTMWLKNIL